MLGNKEFFMIKAVYAGSFDPVTNGHLDIIERAARLFGGLTVLVMKNEDKTPLFTITERMEILRQVVAHIPGVQVETADGFTADYARACGATVLVRGLRGVDDIVPEFIAARFNKNRYPSVETVFFPTTDKWQHVSSSSVKEAASAGADIRAFVPQIVAQALEKMPKSTHK